MIYVNRGIMVITLGLFSLLSTHAYSSTNNSEIVKEHILSNEQRLSVPFYKIFIGEVVSLDGDGRGTNSVPPKGRVRVYEVLRGDLNKSEFPCVWEASFRNSDMIDPTNANYALNEKWKKTLLIAPVIGTKFIGFAKHNKNSNLLIIMHDSIYKDNKHNRDQVRRNAVPPERTGIIQQAANLLLFLMPVLSLVLLRNRPKLSLLFSTLVFPVYLFYESGISSWTNIRIDLFLIYPILLFSAIMVFISGFKMFSSRRMGQHG